MFKVRRKWKNKYKRQKEQLSLTGNTAIIERWIQNVSSSQYGSFNAKCPPGSGIWTLGPKIGMLLREAFNMLKEIHHCRKALGFYSQILVPVCSLWFMVLFGDVSSRFPTPAAMSERHCASLPPGWTLTLWNHNPKQIIPPLRSCVCLTWGVCLQNHDVFITEKKSK